MQVFVVHEKVTEGKSERAQAFQRKKVGWWVVFGEVRVNCLYDEGILREEEGRFGIDAEEEEGIDGIYDLFSQVGLHGHDEVFHLRHDWI